SPCWRELVGGCRGAALRAGGRKDRFRRLALESGVGGSGVAVVEPRRQRVAVGGAGSFYSETRDVCAHRRRWTWRMVLRPLPWIPPSGGGGAFPGVADGASRSRLRQVASGSEQVAGGRWPRGILRIDGSVGKGSLRSAGTSCGESGSHPVGGRS